MHATDTTPDSDLHEILDHVASGKPVDSDLKRRLRDDYEQAILELLAPMVSCYNRLWPGAVRRSVAMTSGKRTESEHGRPEPIRSNAEFRA